MLYNLIQKRKGKETVVMTDELPKVNDRLDTLRKSLRKGIKGQKVTFLVRPAVDGEEKNRLEPHGKSHYTHPTFPQIVRKNEKKKSR